MLAKAANNETQRRRANDVRNATEAALCPCVKHAGSAYVPYKLNAITVPTKEEITAPTADSPNIAVMRFEADICGKLKNRTETETAKPTTSGKPKTTKSESVQDACDTARLR